MSEHSDEIVDNYIFREPDYDDEGFDKTKLWRTKDGTIIEISKMGDCHLVNCLNMVNSKGMKNKYLEEEAIKRRLFR